MTPEEEAEKNRQNNMAMFGCLVAACLICPHLYILAILFIGWFLLNQSVLGQNYNQNQQNPQINNRNPEENSKSPNDLNQPSQQNQQASPNGTSVYKASGVTNPKDPSQKGNSDTKVSVHQPGKDPQTGKDNNSTPKDTKMDPKDFFAAFAEFLKHYGIDPKSPDVQNVFKLFITNTKKQEEVNPDAKTKRDLELAKQIYDLTKMVEELSKTKPAADNTELLKSFEKIDEELKKIREAIGGLKDDKLNLHLEPEEFKKLVQTMSNEQKEQMANVIDFFAKIQGGIEGNELAVKHNKTNGSKEKDNTGVKDPRFKHVEVGAENKQKNYKTEAMPEDSTFQDKQKKFQQGWSHQ